LQRDDELPRGQALGINEDQDEEEISCHRVAEGVAVCMASNGLWMLFETVPF
jgi:hypothetical protein